MRFLTYRDSLEEPDLIEMVVMCGIEFSPPDSFDGAAPPVGITSGENAGKRNQTSAGPEAGAVLTRM